MRHKGRKKQSSTGEIRIISGLHRGRKLPVLDIDGLRPSTGRNKETLFNWLMPYIHGARCLDAFAGAGSLGFEAISRQASSVDFVEIDRSASEQLKQNIRFLKADNANVHHGDLFSALPSLRNTYDIIFVDPPFRQNLVTKLIDNNTIESALAPNGIIYLEYERDIDGLVIPSEWQLLKSRESGQVVYQLYQVRGQNSENPT